MAEWLYEEGIGENRAALVESGAILEARIEVPEGLRVGAVVEARLAAVLVPRRRGIALLADGSEALVEPLPARLSEGASFRAEVTREAVPEHGRTKLARCRPTDSPVAPGPALLDRLGASGGRLTILQGSGPDRLEQAGWSELLEQARSGDIPFEGGMLRMSLAPAMTLFDVDGALDPPALAIAGAAAAGRAIRRFGIGGSIGIDLPTLAARPDRQAAAASLDAALPQPFERTAVNGFGFLQIVRKRERLSLPELVGSDPSAAAARALLRLAERTGGAGERRLVAPPAVIARIEARPDWQAALSRRIGAPVALQPDPGLGIGEGYVHSRFG